MYLAQLYLVRPIWVVSGVVSRKWVSLSKKKKRKTRKQDEGWVSGMTTKASLQQVRRLSTFAWSIRPRLPRTTRLPRAKPLRRSFFPRYGGLLLVRSGGPSRREERVDLRRQGRGRKGSQFSLLSLVLFHEPSPLAGRHFLPAHLPDLVDHPQEHFFRGSRPMSAMLRRAPNISSRHIRGTIDGESDAVRQFSTPS